MDLWNVKDLELPPRNTYKATNRDVDIVALREIINQAFSTFKNDSALKSEAAMLSRCIYRMKTKFRNDKGLKAMEMMNRALLQYLRMDVPAMLESFYNMIPPKYKTNTYLPTLNMLHYILVRTQGLSKLMVRIVDCCKMAAHYMEGRICIGHLWKVAFICFTVVSKIFVLTKQWAKFCCKFYSQLLPFTKMLKNAGLCWLPSDYHLPDDLKLWLDVDWLDKDEITLPKPKKLKIPTIFDIVDSDSDVEFCGEYTEINDDIEFVEAIQSENKSDKKMDDLNLRNEELLSDIKLSSMEIQEDVGEAIKLPADRNRQLPKKNKQKRKRDQCIEEVDKLPMKGEKTKIKNKEIAVQKEEDTKKGKNKRKRGKQ